MLFRKLDHAIHGTNGTLVKQIDPRPEAKQGNVLVHLASIDPAEAVAIALAGGKNRSSSVTDTQTSNGNSVNKKLCSNFQNGNTNLKK